MNNQDKGKEDILSYYIKRDNSEKAPQGFTENLMTRISIEKIPSRPDVSRLRRNIIPAVSIAATVVFIVAALLLGTSENYFYPVTNFISSLRITLPTVDFPALSNWTLPEWLPYIILSILLLAFFDKALFRLFHNYKAKGKG